MKKRNNSRLKGFTLIELLVVVLSIGILSAVALPQYEKAVNKARAAEAWTYAKAFADAQKIYYLSNGGYTTDLSQLDIEMPALKNFTLGSVEGGGVGCSGQTLYGQKGLSGVSFNVTAVSGEGGALSCYDPSNSKKCASLMPCSSPTILGGGSVAHCYF